MKEHNKLEAALWFIATDFSQNLMGCIAKRPSAAQEEFRKKALVKSACAINSAVSSVANGSVYQTVS